MFQLISIVILILDIAAIVDILQSGGSPGGKLLWIILVLIFPLVGMLLYFWIGKKNLSA